MERVTQKLNALVSVRQNKGYQHEEPVQSLTHDADRPRHKLIITKPQQLTLVGLPEAVSRKN